MVVTVGADSSTESAAIAGEVVVAGFGFFFVTGSGSSRAPVSTLPSVPEACYGSEVSTASRASPSPSESGGRSSGDSVSGSEASNNLTAPSPPGAPAGADSTEGGL